MARLLSSSPLGFNIRTLIGQEATKAAILEALFSLRSAQPDDRLVIYFAGHGYTLSDRFGNEKGYVAAADTVPEKDFTALSLNEITDLRLQTAAKHIAFIFDACFSGQALGLTRTASVTAEKFLTRRAYQVISAGAGDQPVADYHSMTHVMVQGLQNRTVSESRLLTLNSLGLFIQQSMAAESARMQIPQFGHLRGSQGGDFVFYQAQGANLPRDLEAALHSDMDKVRWGAVGGLMDIARGSDSELAALAREWLERLASSDPSERVRQLAGSFLDSSAATRRVPRSRTAARSLRRGLAGASTRTLAIVAMGITVLGLALAAALAASGLLRPVAQGAAGTPVVDTETLLPTSTELLSITPVDGAQSAGNATVGVAAPTGAPGGAGYRLSLSYTDRGFYLFNPGDRDLEISPIVFEALDAAAGTPTQYRFEGKIWAQFFLILEKGKCDLIEITGTSAYQSRPTECGSFNAQRTPRSDSNDIFWLPRDGITVFRVLWNGQEVGRCEIAAGRCEISLPPG